MLLEEFDYNLPGELIAQFPIEKRDSARMLVIDRKTGTWSDHEFRDLPQFLGATDTLVLNNTRVFPARLIGRRMPGTAKCELFLVRELEPNVWEALARPARRLPVGTLVQFAVAELQGEIMAELENGRRVVRFSCAGSLEELIDRAGRTPLPPYIKRETSKADADSLRYQTVYASRRGAIAAPTAGLHFTPETLAEVRARGCHIVEVTLHVGYGTFEPVRVSDISLHEVSAEHFEITPAAAAALNHARANGHRIIAIGTTTTRALECCTQPGDRFASGLGEADLTMTPGYKFHAIDALLTNFHLPQSSLLLLCAAFAGKDLLLAAYRHAVNERYRFYSYGDCMLII